MTWIPWRVLMMYHLRGCRLPRQPLLVLAMARTGSNLLVSLLNSVPGVSMAGEILNSRVMEGFRGRPRGGKAALDHILRSLCASGAPVAGAKLMLGHFERRGITPEDLLKILPQVKFIILYRRSLLDQFISREFAQRTGEWVRGESPGRAQRLSIDPAAFKSYCCRMRGFYSRLITRSWLAQRSILLCYEDLASEPQRVFDTTIFPFLGLPSRPVRTTMRKQVTKRPEEIVENYAEIAPLVKDGTAEIDLSFSPGTAS